MLFYTASVNAEILPELTAETFKTLPKQFFLSVDPRIFDVAPIVLDKGPQNLSTVYYLQFQKEDQTYGIEVETTRRNGSKDDLLVIRHRINSANLEISPVVAEKLKKWWEKENNRLFSLPYSEEHHRMTICTVVPLRFLSPASTQNLIKKFIEIIPEVEEKAGYYAKQ